MIEYQQSTKQEQKDWLDLGKTYGLVKARHYRVIYGACEPTKETKGKDKYLKEESDLVYQWFSEQLPYRIKDVCLFRLKGSNHFAIFVQHKCDALEDHLIETANALTNRLPFRMAFG